MSRPNLGLTAVPLPDLRELLDAVTHGRLPGAARRTGSMHAKCVVVDDASVLIGSANFTARGHQRNVEVGVRIDAPRFAARLAAQWNGLAGAGKLVRAR